MIVREEELDVGTLPVNKIILGDAYKVLKKLPDNSIDAVVTDPPYGLEFMNQDWDRDVPPVKFWKEVLRVMKHGAHLLSFFGTRTYHRGVVNIEDAGFEIRDMIVWLYGCVSEDTEILTTEGWKKYNEIKEGDEVFTLNLQTGKIEKDVVLKKFVYRVKDKMLHIRNDNTDQLVTLNHKIILDIATRVNHDKENRKYIMSRVYYWTFASNLLKIHGKIRLPLAGIYDGDFSIGTDLAELLGWILSDGSIIINKNEKSIRIYQSSVKGHYVKRIRELLNRLNINYKEYKRTRKYKNKVYTFHEFFFSREKNKEIFDKIVELIPNNKPTYKLLCLKYEERLALINGLVRGDGTLVNGRKWGAFYQKDEEFLVWFQTLLHLSGLQGRINLKKKCCHIHYNDSTELQLVSEKKRKQYLSIADYEGIVWSIRTNNMTYIARRNGKIFITGNSGFPKGQAIDKLIDKELGAFEKRKIIGMSNRHGGGRAFAEGHSGFDTEVHPITEPATPEAKKWQGWNTALKPACEPIVLARKPISEKNIARNVLKWGVGGLNIDACRIGDSRPPTVDDPYKFKRWKEQDGCKRSPSCNPDLDTNKGRYPANVILDEEASKMLDEQSGIVKRVDLRDSCKSSKGGMFFKRDNGVVVITRRPIDLGGGASRFFYCAKAGRDERFAYCQDCNEVIPQKEWEKHKNHKLIFHTTVKPLKLIEYLVRLVTPPNGIVLDPFFGTGTTGIACLKQGFRFIGIEIDPIYCKIAEHRLKPYVKQKTLLEF